MQFSRFQYRLSCAFSICMLLLAGQAITRATAQVSAMEQPQLIVIAPANAVAAGDEVSVTVYFQQFDTAENEFPEQLQAHISRGDVRKPVTMQRASAANDNDASGTGLQQARYTFTVTTDIENGVLSIQVLNWRAPPVFMQAYTPGAPESPAQQPKQGISIASTDESSDEDLIRNDFLGSIYAYHPTYFIAGADADDAKFQLSFKYRFINDNSDIASEYEWLRGFYFAYTQLSLWDLSADSFPFEDTNFLPELFYQFNDVNIPLFDFATHADLKLGLLHESNGRDGDDSRTLNIAYLEPALHFDLKGDYQLSITPRVWAYFGDQTGNENIEDFRGYGSLTTTFGRRNGFQLEALFRGNPGTGNGSMQLDFTYPLTRVTNNSLGFYLHAQLFRGFGESLLDFDQRDTRFRIGLGLVR